MLDKKKALVLGSFIGDALALGVHWVYNTRVIDKKFGVVEAYHDPLTSHHTGKKKGDFTHYGDQMMVLLESVEACNGFDLDHFAVSWRAFFEAYQGYFDQATKATLQNIAEGKDHQSCGSSSDELAGATRIAPLVYVFHGDRNALIQAARRQTAFSHNHPTVIDGAEFFSRVAIRVLEGELPSLAVTQITAEHFEGHAIQEIVEMGTASRELNTRQAIAEFGQACDAESAFPATIHLVVKYENDFRKCLIENVMAGGDSAARGMLAGMLLGAHNGMDSIPEDWLNGLTLRPRILKTLDNLMSTH